MRFVKFQQPQVQDESYEVSQISCGKPFNYNDDVKLFPTKLYTGNEESHKNTVLRFLSTCVPETWFAMVRFQNFPCQHES